MSKIQVSERARFAFRVYDTSQTVRMFTCRLCLNSKARCARLTFQGCFAIYSRFIRLQGVKCAKFNVVLNVLKVKKKKN